MKASLHITGWIIVTLLLMSGTFLASFIHPPQKIHQEFDKSARQVIDVARKVHDTVTESTKQSTQPSPGTNTSESKPSRSAYAEGVLRASMIIFLNNIKVMGILAIPVFSMFYAPIFALVNGFVINTLTTDYIGKSPIYAIETLLLAPHTWFEFLSYGIALFESSVIGWKLFKKRQLPNKEEVKDYAYSLIVAIAFLFVAAISEVIIIVR